MGWCRDDTGKVPVGGCWDNTGGRTILGEHWWDGAAGMLMGNHGGDHLTSRWRSTLARGREAERGGEARPLAPPRPRPRPFQTQDAGDQRGGRLRGFPPDQQQRDSGPGRQHQPPPPLESVNGHGPHFSEEKGVLAPLCVEGGVLTFPPPTPAPLISNPAALCVLGVGGG